MLTLPEMADLLSKHSRQSPQLTRSVELLSHISLTGDFFSYFDTGLHPQQESRAVALHVKAGLVKEVESAIPRVRKARYQLTDKYYTAPDPPPVEKEPVSTNWMEEMVEWEDMPDLTPEQAAIHDAQQAQLQAESDAQRLEYIMQDDLRKIEAKLGKLKPSVKAVVTALQLGDKTREELLQTSSSDRTMRRALKVLRDAGLVTVSGASRTRRVYSLVLISDWDALNSQEVIPSDPLTIYPHRCTTTPTKAVRSEGASL